MTVLALDIETVPTLAALAQPYPADERTPPTNYGPDAREKWREKDRAAWEQERIKQYSLSPLWGRVVAVGLAWEDVEGELVAHTLLAREESDEAALLAEVWDTIHGSALLVTWNGLTFDLPFLAMRSVVHRQRPPFDLARYLKRYSTAPHYDVRQVVTGWDSRARGTLDDYLTALDLPRKTAHGSEVFAMAQAGAWDDLGAYAKDDALATLALYHRVSVVF